MNIEIITSIGSVQFRITENSTTSVTVLYFMDPSFNKHITQDTIIFLVILSHLLRSLKMKCTQVCNNRGSRGNRQCSTTIIALQHWLSTYVNPAHPYAKYQGHETSRIFFLKHVKKMCASRIYLPTGINGTGAPTRLT